MTTALLVVDVQNALCHGRWSVHEPAAMIERINALIARARAAGAPVVFIQHEEDFDAMRAGSEGWQLDARLDAQPGDPRVRKTACDAFLRTGLQALLEQCGVRDLVVCGLQTEYCVDTTVRRALGLGWPVVLAGDAHSTMDNDVLKAPQIIAHHNATLAQLGNFGPTMRVQPAAEVVFAA